MRANIIFKHRYSVLYGIVLAVLIVLLKWLELKFVIIDSAMDVYTGSIAIVFTALGVWLAIKLTKPKVETVVVEKEVYIVQSATTNFEQNEKELEKTGLSPRELEVLKLMAEGLSNQEIANQLFVSLNTVKTHSSKLYEKLDVKRRTQAVDKAKRLNIIA